MRKGFIFVHSFRRIEVGKEWWQSELVTLHQHSGSKEEAGSGPGYESSKAFGSDAFPPAKLYFV